MNPPPEPIPGARLLFSLDPAIAYLNHGAFGAVPVAVQRAQQRLRDEMETNPHRFFTVGLPERITSAQALALFADFAAIAVGAAADLVLLSVSYDEALGRLCRDDVVLTIVAGEIVHDTR